MSIDISFHQAPKDFLLQWLEGRGERLVYLPRFNSEFNNGFCPRCADIDEKLETDPNCPICYGTGFAGGWGSPYTGINSPYQRVYGIFSYNTVVTDWDQSGPVRTEQDQKLSIAMIQEPKIGDLVIDHTGARYRVGVNVRDWTFNNDQIGWHIVVFQATPDDTIYTVPVPVMQASLPISNDNYSSLLQLRPQQLMKLVLQVNNF